MTLTINEIHTMKKVLRKCRKDNSHMRGALVCKKTHPDKYDGKPIYIVQCCEPQTDPTLKYCRKWEAVYKVDMWEIYCIAN